MRLRATLSLLPLLILLADCTSESAEAGKRTDVVHPLADTLAVVEADYEALRLREALVRARRLRVLMEEATSAVPQEVLAGGYHYLAMLHYEHAVHFDSVAYFTVAASTLPIIEELIVLRARQQLCEALANRNEWEWVEMDMTSALGLALLESIGKEQSVLYGDLLILQGRARKKRGDHTTDPTDQKLLWEQSGAILRRAVATFEGLHSPHVLRAMEDLGILYCRLPEYDDQVAILARNIATGGKLAKTDYVVPQRLLGYRHYKHGRSDSSVYYYQSLLSHQDHFRTGYRDEPFYCIREGLRAKGDYAAALAINKRSLVALGCCPTPASPDSLANESACLQQFGCLFELIQQADTYYRQYAAHGRVDDLKRSFGLVTVAINSYEKFLANLSQESVFYRANDLGAMVTGIALRSAFAMARVSPRSAHFDLALQAMELSKSYILAKELSQLARGEDRTVFESELASIRQLDTKLMALQQAYTLRQSLPLPQLAAYAGLDARRDRLQADGALRFGDLYRQDSSFTKGVGVAEVQQHLSPEQALIEFSETIDSIYVLYVDADTTIAYTVDTSVVETVREFVALIAPGIRAPPSTGPHAVLFERLLRPAYSSMKARRELLIAPTTSLGALPFAAVPLPSQITGRSGGMGAYLVNRHDIRYLDSWRLELQYAERKASSPTTRRPTAGIWTNPDLQGYLGPIGELLTARLGTGTDHYQSAACTATSLLTHFVKYDWLHLSVHARGNPKKLNDNYLYLTHTDSLNGIHIGEQPLHAQLVVLAACSTASGYSNLMDGTYSLRRSFHRAGVPDVVSSLYEIPAAASAALYGLFYRRLLLGDSPAAALAFAQRSCQEGSLGPRWQHPYYWAGIFVG